MPASYRFAANAAKVGLGAARLNPAGLVTSALAAFLLPYGIKLVSGVFMKDDVAQCWYNGNGVCYSSMQAAGDRWPYPSKMYCVNSYPTNCVAPSGTAAQQVGMFYMQAGTNWWQGPINLWSGAPEPTTRPATDQDWAAPMAATLPDPVLAELAAKGVPLPLENPVFNPDHAEVPLNEPTPDPVTGKPTRDVAIITPTKANPEEAKLEVVEEVTDSQGNPVTNSDGTKQATETKDPCLENPGRIGCSEWGKPDDSDLETNTKNISITPQGGFGPDSASCPADLTYTIHQGTTLRLSYAPVCKAGDMFRPIILGLAWITSILTFLGISRRAQG